MPEFGDTDRFPDVVHVRAAGDGWCHASAPSDEPEAVRRVQGRWLDGTVFETLVGEWLECQPAGEDGKRRGRIRPI